jgi:hypothetical protein
MKKLSQFTRFFLLMIIVFVSQIQLSAQTIKDVFSKTDTKIFYYGVDFTKAKLIDDLTTNENDIVSRQYTGINQLTITHPEKFDFNAAFGRTIEHDLSATVKRNEKVKPESVKSSNSGDFSRFKESDIADIVKNAEADPKNGVGLLFVVEAMSKSAKSAAIWVTLFDPKTKKVLMTERMEGKAGGFGFPNYWGNTIKDILGDIKKKKYKEWQTKYGG